MRCVGADGQAIVADRIDIKEARLLSVPVVTMSGVHQEQALERDVAKVKSQWV